jgi:hypothetical protein
MHILQIVTSVVHSMQRSCQLYASSTLTPKPRIPHSETSELEAWCVKDIVILTENKIAKRPMTQLELRKFRANGETSFSDKFLQILESQRDEISQA